MPERLGAVDKTRKRTPRLVLGGTKQNNLIIHHITVLNHQVEEAHCQLQNPTAMLHSAMSQANKMSDQLDFRMKKKEEGGRISNPFIPK
jgi:hypothetical protein